MLGFFLGGPLAQDYHCHLLHDITAFGDDVMLLAPALRIQTPPHKNNYLPKNFQNSKIPQMQSPPDTEMPPTPKSTDELPLWRVPPLYITPANIPPTWCNAMLRRNYPANIQPAPKNYDPVTTPVNSGKVVSGMPKRVKTDPVVRLEPSSPENRALTLELPSGSTVFFPGIRSVELHYREDSVHARTIDMLENQGLYKYPSPWVTTSPSMLLLASPEPGGTKCFVESADGTVTEFPGVRSLYLTKQP